MFQNFSLLTMRSMLSCVCNRPKADCRVVSTNVRSLPGSGLSTFEVRGAPLAARPVEAEGRNELDRGVRRFEPQFYVYPRKGCIGL
jgi:hypothetical protein